MVAGGIYYFAINYAIAVNYVQTIDVQKLVISFVFILLMRTLHPHLVQQSLALADWNLDFKQVFSIVSISQLGKYIPGGIWQFVARFSAYRENQLSYKDIGKSFIIENVWLVLGSLFVGLFFVFLGQPAFLLEPSGASFRSNILLIVATLCLLLWALTVFATEYGLRSANRKPSSLAASKQFISQTCMWIFLGISFACLFQEIGSLNNFLMITGVFILSFLAGYVAIFAPGGIGVREYFAVLLLSFLFSGSEIGIIAIVHRLLYTLAEFLLAGISLLLNRKNQLPGNKPDMRAVQDEQLNEI